ncbi:MAG: ankyrin repeat domain-containing protein [Lachnospiraceae bacterium]|nr:ankyrin repeat domain-containing protein [Lachnospiraceae bacterium]
MKKLFKAIRQENLEEVKSIIEKNPQLVNCVATPPPKKDNGQSPLQVAIKISALEIIDYLIVNGADVNFMEAEDDDPGVRCPVLHDAIRMVMMSLCYKKFDVSDQGIKVVRELLKRGADPNKRASNGFDALNMAISDAEYVLEKEIYSDSWKKAEQQIIKLFDLLIEYGADFESWANRGHFPEPAPMESNKVRYLDDFVAKEDTIQEYTFRGKKYETVIKGDVDDTAHTRAIMQRYCKERGLI